MHLMVKLINGTGLVGRNPKTGETYIINTGRSFTGITEDGKKCTILNSSSIPSLKEKIQSMIVIHGNEVLDNDVLIAPDSKWTLARIE
ncbi:hypothetical protein N4G40_11050 [Pantoea eucrina]|uniref:Uncharacterized protein n=1 Tax=Pantoea eucrina TaxID=472693 RepID=A0ABU5LFT2_9GAMM|nr:hypothetical protein [Pantoea eucrina]MDZ7278808.1 hypothetical protein [Pantoea eucrina]